MLMSGKYCVQEILRRMSGNKVIFVAGGGIDDCRRKVGGRRQIILPFLLLAVGKVPMPKQANVSSQSSPGTYIS